MIAGRRRRLPNISAHANTVRTVWIGLLTFACLLPTGCSKPTAAKMVHGCVTCGTQKVPFGTIAFVPMAGTSGPVSSGAIVDGHYRIESRGGVAVGKHRVLVDAKKNTGRKIRGSNGLEVTMIDEQVRMGPDVYTSDQSPLIAEIRDDSDEQFDITLPPR